jgi:hypothetical protein
MPQTASRTAANRESSPGIVLYAGSATLPFGLKLRAIPVSALWQLQPGDQADA